MASKYDIPTTSRQLNEFSIPFETQTSSFWKPLDDLLRCHICFEYFNNCMMTKCSHNYCSLCIRKYMMYKSQCPSCFKYACEPELQNNRIVDEILHIYKKLRVTFEGEEVLQAASPTPEYESVIVKCEPDISIDAIEETDDETSIPTPSIQQDNERIIPSQSTAVNDDVPCPVCNKKMPLGRINVHLDMCLKNPLFESSKKKTLPKVVYHLLPDKAIRKKLKDHGLATNGDRQMLIQRHKNFLVLYNANCDSLNPKSVEDIIAEVESRENEERANTPHEKPLNRKSDPEDIERENELYISQHQDQFSSLIKDVYSRDQSQKRKNNRHNLENDVQSASNAQFCDVSYQEENYGTRNILDESDNTREAAEERMSTENYEHSSGIEFIKEERISPILFETYDSNTSGNEFSKEERMSPILFENYDTRKISRIEMMDDDSSSNASSLDDFNLTRTQSQEITIKRMSSSSAKSRRKH